MSLSAHPSVGVLSDYASGALHTAPGVVVLAHLQFCTCCQGAVRTFEEVGGALLHAAPPERMGLAALGRVLKGIEDVQPTRARPGSRRRARTFSRRVVGIELGARRFLAPGRWFVTLRASQRRNWRLYMLRAPAGPQHAAWPGGAMVCVLDGGFRRGGRSYRVGDFAAFPQGSRRRLAVISGGAFVAIVAAKRSWAATQLWGANSS